MGEAKRRKLREKIRVDKPLRGRDAYQVTLISTCEATILELQRSLKHEPDNYKRETRKYWLQRMSDACVGMNETFDGYVSKEFENKFVKYHKWIELEMKNLLKNCETLNK